MIRGKMVRDPALTHKIIMVSSVTLIYCSTVLIGCDSDFLNFLKNFLASYTVRKHQRIYPSSLTLASEASRVSTDGLEERRQIGRAHV